MSRELGVQFARGGHPGERAVPGPVNTPLLQELFAKDPERAQRRLVHIPMGRFGEAEEIAAAVAFLASDDASFITASTFLVDGASACLRDTRALVWRCEAATVSAIVAADGVPRADAAAVGCRSSTLSSRPSTFRAPAACGSARRRRQRANWPDLLDVPLTPVPWCPTGFELPPDARLGQHPARLAGLFYLQEPSSMSPAETLAPSPGAIGRRPGRLARWQDARRWRTLVGPHGVSHVANEGGGSGCGRCTATSTSGAQPTSSPPVAASTLPDR